MLNSHFFSSPFFASARVTGASFSHLSSFLLSRHLHPQVCNRSLVFSRNGNFPDVHRFPSPVSRDTSDIRVRVKRHLLSCNETFFFPLSLYPPTSTCTAVSSCQGTSVRPVTHQMEMSEGDQKTLHSAPHNQMPVL